MENRGIGCRKLCYCIDNDEKIHVATPLEIVNLLEFIHFLDLAQ